MSGSVRLLILVVLLASGLSRPAAAIELEMVPVSEPGNPCDPQAEGCFGAVAYPFEIGRYEVTNAQYAAFLNSVATPVDPFDLYKGQPGIDYPPAPVGALRFYEVVPGMGNRPVNWVTFYDALRFVNWLHNGQPVGAQGPATTEDGAYRITIDAIAGNEFPRQPGASWFVPSEDEWYKAAYYDPTLPGYWDWPTRSDTTTTCAGPTVTPGRANCNGAFGGVSAVGAYSGAAGPWGTFDQGGNVWEMHDSETTGVFGELFHGIRGGSYPQDVRFLAASFRSVNDSNFSLPNVGFRVARVVPEPAGGAAGALASLALLQAARGRRSDPYDAAAAKRRR